MRAAVLREPGLPLEIEDVELDAPGTGELTVRVEAAGACHSDLHYMLGDITCRLPVVMGHEGAGIVEALGPGTSGAVTVGDRVAFMWRPHCGRCAACISGNPVLCASGRVQATTGGLLDGTTRLRLGGETLHHFLGVSCLAERVVISERAVVPVPDGVPAEIAAITGCAVVTGVSAVLNVVQRAAGRGIVVFGVGGVGLSSVMGARLVGADPIVAVDVDVDELALARRLGATHTVNAGSSDAVELVQGQKRIVGSLYGSANPLIDLPRIFGLYLSGRLPLDDLIGERFPLGAVNDAYARLTMGGVGRSVVVP